MQAIERLREVRPELQGSKIACAGRLDPMAEGVLIVLAGEELKKFEEYCGLDKVYEAEILFGLKSYSEDVMGLVESHSNVRTGRDLSVQKLDNVLNELKGKVQLPVPLFSSWRVRGKPMYWWARQGRLEEIEVPVHQCSVFGCELVGSRMIGVEELRQSVMERLNVVRGDFRQEGIKRQWELILHGRHEPFHSAKIRIHCSSGTYIRSIVQLLGERLQAGTMLFRLVRTRVGEFSLDATLRWLG